MNWDLMLVPNRSRIAHAGAGIIKTSNSNVRSGAPTNVQSSRILNQNNNVTTSSMTADVMRVSLLIAVQNRVCVSAISRYVQLIQAPTRNASTIPGQIASVMPGTIRTRTENVSSGATTSARTVDRTVTPTKRVGNHSMIAYAVQVSLRKKANVPGRVVCINVRQIPSLQYRVHKHSMLIVNVMPGTIKLRVHAKNGASSIAVRTIAIPTTIPKLSVILHSITVRVVKDITKTETSLSSIASAFRINAKYG